MIHITVNSQALAVAENTTLAGLLQAQGHSAKRLAVERNGAIVPRSTHDSVVLQAGDTVEIVIAVGGG